MNMHKCIVCHQPYTISSEEAAAAKKFDAVQRTLCFFCDQKQRLSFRNDRMLYKRTCDCCHSPVVSIYAPDSPFVIYKNEYWHSDAWDPLSYGIPFNVSRPFFEQFQELHQRVPRLALMNFKAENSDYCNMTYGNKDCYLVFGGDLNENCLYGTLGMNNRDMVDFDLSHKNEHCYMVSDIMNCYDCRFAFDSKNCTSCYFISDCSGCSDCILCTNLVNQSYCINNVQYTKEEYARKKAELLNGSFQQQQVLWDQFVQLRLARVVKYVHALNADDCIGDYLKNCHECRQSFDVADSENLMNVIFASASRDITNASLVGNESECCYNTISTIGAYNCLCSFCVIDSSDIAYSDFIENSQNLFGCVGVRGKKFCILNTQYTEAEYTALRERIVKQMKDVGEWGQFFPKEISCFGYNESTAQGCFPLTKEQAMVEGFRWREREGEAKRVTAQAQIPDHISDVSDALCTEAIRCEACAKSFKIIPQELAFYKQHYIPVPRSCSECRHATRTRLRNPRELWGRTCAQCDKKIQTSYAPERTETVLCETCYGDAIR